MNEYIGLKLFVALSSNLHTFLNVSIVCVIFWRKHCGKSHS
jgi:hypothetical protein